MKTALFILLTKRPSVVSTYDLTNISAEVTEHLYNLKEELSTTFQNAPM